jgi:hypothetical protein
VFGCRHHDCPGHGDILEAILHIQEYIVTTVEQVQTDFAAYQGDVTNALSGLQASVADLRDQLAAALQNVGGVPAAVQAKLDELDGQITAADAALKPAPAEPTNTDEPAPSETPAA